MYKFSIKIMESIKIMYRLCIKLLYNEEKLSFTKTESLNSNVSEPLAKLDIAGSESNSLIFSDDILVNI